MQKKVGPHGADFHNISFSFFHFAQQVVDGEVENRINALDKQRVRSMHLTARGGIDAKFRNATIRRSHRAGRESDSPSDRHLRVERQSSAPAGAGPDNAYVWQSLHHRYEIIGGTEAATICQHRYRPVKIGDASVCVAWFVEYLVWLREIVVSGTGLMAYRTTRHFVIDKAADESLDIGEITSSIVPYIYYQSLAFI